MTPFLIVAQAVKGRKPSLTEIERIANRLSPQLRKRFLEAVQSAQDKVDLEALARAVQSGSVTQAELATKLAEWPERYGAMATDLRAGFLAGMGTATGAFEGASSQLRMDLINPYAVQYAQRKLSRIVQAYREDAKATIRTVITESVSGKHTAREAAKIIQESIGLTPRYERAVENLRERLVAEGFTGDKLEEKVARYREKLLKSRAQTIARTEIVQAQVSGQRKLWEVAATEGLFDKQTSKRVWKVNHEGATNRGNPTPCPICEPMRDQAIPFSEVYDHPDLGQFNVFGDALDGPPLHPNCLCHEVLEFA